MGKPTGFLEYSRISPKKDRTKARTKHYREFVHPYSDTQLNEQAARCMDCGIPFCHSGCPLGNVIPEFNDAVYDGNWEDAYRILTSTNNFPEFTGRICPAPCESACVLGINRSPVAIEEIEKHIIEIAFKKGFVKPDKSYLKTGKQVAIIGSGPAGLACAAQLNKAGHQVTVYERDDKAGGLLRYGIPDFKLDKTIVDRRIDLLRESGITFRLNAEVGQNVTTDELKQYDAVVLAVGSTVPRDLPVPGRSLSGVHFAMEFLKQQNKRLSGSLPDGQNISAEGKNVVVIGGGDTGSDCVGTSNRQGATSVTQLELLPLPPTERTANMPWPSYPMLLKTTSSHEEGCQRHWAINTKAFIGDERNQLRAIKVVDVKWEIDPQGRPSGFVEIAGTEREIPCELVTLALGFLHPQKEGLLDELGIELTERGQVAADECSFQTNIPHIFAAGDLRRGQSLVVWAISEGRECAKKVDEFLMGSSSLESKDRETERHLAH